MVKNQLTVSVVLPVYNDANYIHDCLSAVQAQTFLPLEVIVVDNNCTDDSMAIAKRFKFVRIIKEKKQGLSNARKTGFDTAKGDLLLRIDADTILPVDYVEKLIYKATKHPDIAGFTGYGITRNVLMPSVSIIWSWSYFTFSHAYLGYPMLWGANMAIRRSFWEKLNPYLIGNDLAVHEDQDLTLALVSVGGKPAIFNDLRVSVNMHKLLEYSQYRKYGLMLHLLKILDAQHERSHLPSRLPKTAKINRVVYWLVTVLGVYGYYLVTIAYGILRKIKKVKAR